MAGQRQGREEGQELSLLDELAEREPAQLTIEGSFVGHRQVVAAQERLEREERERIRQRREEEAAAKQPQPMAEELMASLFDD